MKRFFPIAAALAVLAGCRAYTWTSSVPEDMRTVSVPTFRNETDVVELGAVATRQTLREFQREGSFKVMRPGDAAIEVQGVIRSLAMEKMTMLIVTHEMKFARDVSTRVFFMNEGVIYEDGTPEQIFQNPKRAATRAFVHRIRSLVFDIVSRDFDFYDMTTQIKQFCIRYSIPEKMNDITHIVEEMLILLSKYDSPVLIEVNHSEMDYTSSVSILHRGESVSPLERPDADELSVMIIRGMSSDIKTEQTDEGVRLTFRI